MNTRGKRIDYKLLNTEGVIQHQTEKHLSEELNNMSINDGKQITDLQVDSMVIIEEVKDVIAENFFHQLTTSELDAVINKLETLRQQLRRRSLQIGTTDLPINETITSIKEYIMAAKDFKSKARLREEKSKGDVSQQEQRSIIFLIDHIGRQMEELEQVFQKDVKTADIEVLLRWRSESPTYVRKFDKIADNYKEVLKSPIKDADRMHNISSIGDRYDRLSNLKHTFMNSLDEEIETQEVDKLRRFTKTQLNIKLERFSGYDSPTDFFTFKSNFEKVHLLSTPKKLLPDLLKNNFLKEPALTLVKHLDDIDVIWNKLDSAYGDARIMLRKKMQHLYKVDVIKTSNSEKLTVELGKITNMLHDVMKLSNDHNIEEYLYHGEGLTNIYHLLGDRRVTKFLTSTCDDKLTPKETWTKLLEFIEREKKVHQQKALLHTQSSDGDQRKPSPQHNGGKRQLQAHNNSQQPSSTVAICQICKEPDGFTNHVATSGPNGSRLLQYFTCKEFVITTPALRLKMLRDKNFCIQCLYPGAHASSGKHAEGRCQRDFVCPHPIHSKYPVKKHVLVCEDHKNETINQDLLKRYVNRFIRNPSLPDFSRNLSLTEVPSEYHKINNIQCSDRGIYLLQYIHIDGQQYLAFFDNGCSDFVVSLKAIKRLGQRCTKESSNTVILGGVGNCQTESKLGTYSVKLPLHDGRQISLSGVCLETIASKMAEYPLEDVARDIQISYTQSGGTRQLPKLPNSIGGEVDLMIGIKYLRYHPKLVHQMSTGLSLFESQFQDATGRRGVISGPHPIFTNIHHNELIPTIHHIQRPDVPLLGFKDSSPSSSLLVQPDQTPASFISNSMKIFEEVEATGSEISYRCPRCRSCHDCKHASNDIISVKEEVEQSLINASVTIDFNTHIAKASLPFISDPTTRLSNNTDKAMKVYQQQIKKLNNPANSKDKQDILDSEAKLQNMGYVEYLHNLPSDVQSNLLSKTKYIIPWRGVWKGNSISTPCRIVFDASSPTSSGYSLNDILAKGRNNLNKLQEVLIRWSVHHVAIHTDIRKMYNTIKLDEKDWCYQLYFWHQNLELNKKPELKVIKTLIYGVRSSGNQAEYALRKVADVSKEEFPEANEIVQHDIYVDDCLTGESTRQIAHQRADELELMLNRGSFALKGIAFSREEPPQTLSDDGDTIHIAGLKWFVKSDEISLNISEINFAKKVRGKKPSKATNIIPAKLTRRHCASKVAEVFDLTGRVAPLIASMKIDLQQLVKLGLDWDDTIPEHLRQMWESNFEMMKEIGNLRFKRAVIPEDAVNLEINTLDFGDASDSMACVSIYVRFLRRNGSYSCQLILSRTRVIPKGFTQPRGELYAGLINTHTGEIVRRSLKKWHQSSTKLTDSQIVLHWIDNDEKPLKPWVRNRVVEIKRITSKDQWFYVNTDDMIADLGTRKGATLQDVNQDSAWINGHQWMKLDCSRFPIKSAENLKLTESDMTEVQKESHFQIHHTEANLSEVRRRHEFSKYLIDPNHRTFSQVVRILANVMRFCHNIRVRKADRNLSPTLTNDEITAAENYYFRKASDEIRQFLPPKKFEPITTDKNGILFYNGRILPENKITIVGRYTNQMIDLSSTTFCVPVIDRHSPIAFSIISDVHWNSQVKHSGIETTLREVMKKAFVIEGRSLVKIIKKSCYQCRLLKKHAIEAAMGPIPNSSLTIAPAFYHSQVDLSGPYKAYSPQHKRTTVKIWLAVYCCCVTSAIVINVMDDYSTTAFLQSFIRFSTRYGFPSKVFCDEGSQLVKGTKEMMLNFNDIKFKLHKERGITMQTCPVGAHNMHGKVERKVKEVNASLERTVHNERLSILQWETICSVISNSINDLPLAIGNVTDVENMDLLTPNRLLLGRNNNRSPTGNLLVNSNPTKLMNQSSKIYGVWFESWLLNHVPKLMKQSKWFKHDRNLQSGDVVLFTKVDSLLSKQYTYGIIKSIKLGNDSKVRHAIVQYRNHNENVSRETSRSVRDLVLIHSVDDLDLMKEIGEMARNVDIMYQSKC